jgi:hypothetical protein
VSEANVSLFAVSLESFWCHFVSLEWEMVVDSLLGTFTSGGEDSFGLFRILSLRSVFITVPKKIKNVVDMHLLLLK